MKTDLFIDLIHCSAYKKRVGKEAEKFSFEDIEAGNLWYCINKLFVVLEFHSFVLMWLCTVLNVGIVTTISHFVLLHFI
jgi:hypothetical protein